jgi:hypothetical protein
VKVSDSHANTLAYYGTELNTSVKSFMAQVPEANPCEFFHRLKHGTIIEGEGSVPLTSSLRQLVLQKSK